MSTPQAVPPPFAAPHRAAVLVVIGAGPRATGLLERIALNAADLLPAPRDLTIHVVDPFPAGSGRVWRDGQSPLLWMNSQAQDITMFTDETVDCAGPRRPGPTLYGWAREHGTSAAADPGLAAEAAALTPTSFASRRLAGAYLRWCFRQARDAMPPGVRTTVHETSAVALAEQPGGGQIVTLSSGAAITADVVVLAAGNQEGGLDARQRAFAGLAADHGGGYVPPAYTADLDLGVLPPGRDVLVSGFGQAFADLMVLVTEGRGGAFVRDSEGTLRYRPSGDEPVLRVGSRRGLPAFPKPAQGITAGRGQPPRFADPGRFRELLGAGAPGGAEAWWDAVCKDLGWAYYRELFLGHPGRVRQRWETFSGEFAELAWNEPAMAALVARAVPDPEDRMELPPERSPLEGRMFRDEAALRAWMDGYLRRVLRKSTDPRSSGQAAALDALLGLVRGSLTALTTGDGVLDQAASRILEQVAHLARLFGSGLPPYRFEQLRALSAAGLVRYLGSGLELAADRNRGVFVARSGNLPEPAESAFLVEARLPQDDLLADASSLWTGLLRTGHGRAVRYGDGSVRLAVDGHSFAVVDGAGHSARRRFALGAFASGGALGSLSMPYANAPFFRQNDALARRVLRELAAVEAAGSGARDGGAPCQAQATSPRANARTTPSSR